MKHLLSILLFFSLTFGYSQIELSSLDSATAPTSDWYTLLIDPGPNPDTASMMTLYRFNEILPTLGNWQGVNIQNISDDTGNDLLIGTTGASGDVSISAQGSDSNVGIILTPKGTEDVYVDGNEFKMGTTTTTGTSRTISALGSQSQIGFSFVPKGNGAISLETSGAINLGGTSTATTNRSVLATGSESNISITLTPKGTGTLRATSAHTTNISIDSDIVTKGYADATYEPVGGGSASYVQNDGNTGAFTTIKTKIVEIGDWDMDADQSVDVAHGLTLSQIRDVRVMIRNDTGTTHSPHNVIPGIGQVNAALGILINSTNISIERETGSNYDNIGFDSTSFNRGWITITYED